MADIRGQLRADTTPLEGDVRRVKNEAITVEKKVDRLRDRLAKQRQEILQAESRARRLAVSTQAGTSGFSNMISSRMIETGRGLAITAVSSETLRAAGLGVELQSMLTGGLSGFATLGPAGAFAGLMGGSISALFAALGNTRQQSEKMKLAIDEMERRIIANEKAFRDRIEQMEREQRKTIRKIEDATRNLFEEELLNLRQTLAYQRFDVE